LLYLPSNAASEGSCQNPKSQDYGLHTDRLWPSCGYIYDCTNAPIVVRSGNRRETEIRELRSTSGLLRITYLITGALGEERRGKEEDNLKHMHTNIQATSSDLVARCRPVKTATYTVGSLCSEWNDLCPSDLLFLLSLSLLYIFQSPYRFPCSSHTTDIMIDDQVVNLAGPSRSGPSYTQVSIGTMFHDCSYVS